MAVFLFVVIVAIVLGLIGAVAHGLGYLLILGILLLVLDLGYGFRRLRRRPVR